jgi:hypothetical protein
MTPLGRVIHRFLASPSSTQYPGRIYQARTAAADVWALECTSETKSLYPCTSKTSSMQSAILVHHGDGARLVRYNFEGREIWLVRGEKNEKREDDRVNATTTTALYTLTTGGSKRLRVSGQDASAVATLDTSFGNIGTHLFYFCEPRMSFSLVVSMTDRIPIKPIKCFAHSPLVPTSLHNLQITQYFTTSKPLHPNHALFDLFHLHRPCFIQIAFEAVVVHGLRALWLRFRTRAAK